jgi:DNA-binding XRE family transcriptional regulator
MAYAMARQGGLTMKLSEFIKDVRKQLEMSQEQLAKAISVNFSTINRWENEKTVPSNLAQKAFFDFCESNLIEVPRELRGHNPK